MEKLEEIILFLKVLYIDYFLFEFSPHSGRKICIGLVIFLFSPVFISVHL